MGAAMQGRVAFVTGASRGIGKAIALRFAAEGASVAICSRPSPGMADLGTLEGARAEIEALGADVVAIEADLSDPTSGRGELVDTVSAELGPVDVLVNNAAGGGYHAFMDWTDAQIERALQLNFWAPWELIRAALPSMRERGRGSIINVSSASAIQPPGPPFPESLTAWAGTVYGGTKAMLDRWTVSLAAEVQRDGIAVNTLAPQAAAATEALVAHATIPEHLYEPLDTMAEAAVVLATADPEVLTGQVTYSLELLAALERHPLDLRGSTELDGWEPASLGPRIEAMKASRAATGSRGSANPYGIPSGPTSSG